MRGRRRPGPRCAEPQVVSLGRAPAVPRKVAAISRPALSVVTVTRNSGDRLEHWIARAREYADEIVVLVDDSTTDDTLDVARATADVVRLFEHPPHTELFHDAAMRLATGEWLLWMDDDELMNAGFADTRDALLAERELTHFHLPYRWVVRGASGEDRWLDTFPWHPNPRLRLVRNIGSIFWHRGRLHSPMEAQGDGRILDPDEAVMYHLDLRLRSRAQREEKVARYRRGAGPSCEEYYLIEDYARTLSSRPVPEPLDREPSVRAQAAVQKRAGRGDLPAETPRITLADAQAGTARHWADAPVFAAEYLSAELPEELLTNRGYTATVQLRNTSPVRWRTSGPERGRILLSYHWRSAEHGLLLREGDRTLLTAGVDPGGTTTVEAGFWTPYEPGEYLLEWDLVAEDVNWFSERGVAPYAMPVTISGENRLLARPRLVATLPPPRTSTSSTTTSTPDPVAPASSDGAPAPGQRVRGVAARVRSSLGTRIARAADAATPETPETPETPGAPAVSGGNVVPIGPARVLDTRNGTGVTGAILGPVPAGTTVTLRIAGTNGIPDWAVGVVGTLGVVEAGYNGFVNVLGGSGPPNGVVSAYFTDRDPSATQILTALVDGQASIWLSDNFPGTAQLLLDITAYLTP